MARLPKTWNQMALMKTQLRHGVGYNYMRMHLSKIVPFSVTTAFFVWTRGKNDGLKNATCGRVFSRKQRKKSVLKNIRIRVDRTLISLFQGLSYCERAKNGPRPLAAK